MKILLAIKLNLFLSCNFAMSAKVPDLLIIKMFIMVINILLQCLLTNNIYIDYSTYSLEYHIYLANQL